MNVRPARRSAVALVVLAAGASAQSFNIDVGQAGSVPPPATYAGAGEAGVWNSVTAAHITPFTPGPTPQDDLLVDLDGNPTGVGFHQFGGMDLVTDAMDPSVTGDDATLLNDYLATHSATLENCMYLNGLQNGTYEVITYAWMPNDPSVDSLVRFDFVPGNTLIGGAWTGAHVEGVTYSRDIIEVTDGRIGWHSGIPAGGALFPGAAFNGAQVRLLPVAGVPASTTSGLALLGTLLAGAGALRLRKRRLRAPEGLTRGE